MSADYDAWRAEQARQHGVPLHVVDSIAWAYAAFALRRSRRMAPQDGERSATIKRSDIKCKAIMARGRLTGRVIVCGACDWCRSLPEGSIAITEGGPQ